MLVFNRMYFAMTKPQTGIGGDNWCPIGQGINVRDLWCYLFGHKTETKIEHVHFAYGYLGGRIYTWDECKRCEARTIQREL